MDSRESVIDLPVTSQQEEQDSIDDTASEDLEWENTSPRRGRRGRGRGGKRGGKKGEGEGERKRGGKVKRSRKRTRKRKGNRGKEFGKLEGQVIPCWILTQREVSLHKSIVETGMIWCNTLYI